MSPATVCNLMRVVDTHSDRINQILDSDGDAVDLLGRLEHATLTALDDIRAAITVTIHTEEHTPCAS